MGGARAVPRLGGILGEGVDLAEAVRIYAKINEEAGKRGGGRQVPGSGEKGPVRGCDAGESFWGDGRSDWTADHAVAGLYLPLPDCGPSRFI